MNLLVVTQNLLELFPNLLITKEIITERVAKEVTQALATTDLMVEIAKVVILDLALSFRELERVSGNLCEQHAIENASAIERAGSLDCLHDVCCTRPSRNHDKI